MDQVQAARVPVWLALCKDENSELFRRTLRNMELPDALYVAAMTGLTDRAATLANSEEERRDPEARRGILTPMELYVLMSTAVGMNNAQVAEDCSRSIETIKTHVRHIIARLEAPNMQGAVGIAYRLGIL